MKIKKNTTKELTEGTEVLTNIFRIAIRMKEEQEKKRESDVIEAQFKYLF